MPNRNSLSGILVEQAMRKQVISLEQSTSISSSVNSLIKHKVSGLLAVDESGAPVGVLSKTDVMGAYYGAIPIESPLDHIMARPPLYCKVNDLLERALELMREKGVYRLYVKDETEESVVGTLAYPDIVGLLYLHCAFCEHSHARRLKDPAEDIVLRLRVGDCMTKGITSVHSSDSLIQVMEILSSSRIGAILVHDEQMLPAGVISKTDIILAYKHDVDPMEPAQRIMSHPLRVCQKDELLEDAIRTMIFADLHRLFVTGTDGGSIDGIFTLTDAARSRSGSCQACISSRITVERGE